MEGFSISTDKRGRMLVPHKRKRKDILAVQLTEKNFEEFLKYIEELGLTVKESDDSYILFYDGICKYIFIDDYFVSIEDQYFVLEEKEFSILFEKV